MLAPRKKGIGFAVGNEPLSSAFASFGCDVLASDYFSGPLADAWKTSNELGDSLESIYWRGFLSYNDFCSRVSFENIDMNNLEACPKEEYDFAWSSCSFEHLGSLEAGIQFLLNSSKLLKVGGVGVHTTEFNVASNTATIETGESVIYRKSDIEELANRLRRVGCALEAPDFYSGHLEGDVAFDYPPYGQNQRHHIKLLLNGYISTSILLIIRKWA